MTRPQNLVFLGLSLSSSWGNGHATTYRALLRGLAEKGHDITFLERDVPWYRDNRDLREPDWCRLDYYSGVEDLLLRHRRTLARADAVVVGSYVPEGVMVIDRVLAHAGGLVGFYDIDTPVTLAALDRGDCSYVAARQIPMFDVVFSFASGPALKRLEQDFGAEIALPLHCMVDDERYRPLGLRRRWSLGYLGTYSPDRQPALERLLLEPPRRLPNRQFVVAGAQYPDTIAWPANVAYVGHVAPDRHPAFYGGSLFTLNLTRLDMRMLGWSPSVRLFEAAACGTAVISDDWDGLDSFFPRGRAILVAETADDVVAALSGDAAVRAAEIAEAARRLTLARHTGRHRAGELERGLALALAHVRAERPQPPSVLTEGSKHGFRPAAG
jgi:spore maturation protein CgeB